MGQGTRIREAEERLSVHHGRGRRRWWRGWRRRGRSGRRNDRRRGGSDPGRDAGRVGRPPPLRALRRHGRPLLPGPDQRGERAPLDRPPEGDRGALRRHLPAPNHAEGAGGEVRRRLQIHRGGRDEIRPLRARAVGLEPRRAREGEGLPLGVPRPPRENGAEIRTGTHRHPPPLQRVGHLEVRLQGERHDRPGRPGRLLLVSQRLLRPRLRPRRLRALGRGGGGPLRRGRQERHARPQRPAGETVGDFQRGPGARRRLPREGGGVRQGPEGRGGHHQETLPHLHGHQRRGLRPRHDLQGLQRLLPRQGLVPERLQRGPRDHH